MLQQHRTAVWTWVISFFSCSLLPTQLPGIQSGMHEQAHDIPAHNQLMEKGKIKTLIIGIIIQIGFLK
jgi:hypothetical protein